MSTKPWKTTPAYLAWKDITDSRESRQYTFASEKDAHKFWKAMCDWRKTALKEAPKDPEGISEAKVAEMARMYECPAPYRAPEGQRHIVHFNNVWDTLPKPIQMEEGSALKK